MRFVRLNFLLLLVPLLSLYTTARAEDPVNLVRKAVARSTLNQPGTKPFHLKADFEPSFERDKDSGRTGDIEIWWK